MSDEYTPTTEEIRERWMEFDGGPDPDDAAEFDRWLNEQLAAAWDEACKALAWCMDNGSPEDAPAYLQANNPYRKADS